MELGTYDEDKCSLIVSNGKHILDGKKKIFKKKKMLVLRKETRGKDVVFKVVGVIEKKILFSKRPKPSDL